MYVPEHEHHRKRLTLEGDAERAAHRAVRAIAADDVAKGDTFGAAAIGMLEPNGHAFGVLAQRGQRDSPFDFDAEAAEMAGEQALGLVLRQAELRVGQIRKLEKDVCRRMPIDDRPHAFDPDAGIDHVAREPHVVPDLERAGCDADGAAIGQRLHQAIDDAAGGAMPRELCRHGQSDGAGANDQNVRHRAFLQVDPGCSGHPASSGHCWQR